MYLPNELVVAILESLGRHDLKSARLVCKTWFSYASGLLFDTIYVAPNKVDLELFNAITQDPILSKCVRHLVYDGSEFVHDLTKTSYVRDLWAQTALMFQFGGFSPNSPDPHINDWFNDVARREFPLGEDFIEWKDHSFINGGYQEYHEHSVYQERALQSGEFVESLVQGLSRLVSLKSVTLKGGWPCYVRTTLCKLDHGTPLARRWDPFHLCPHEWSREPGGDDFKGSPDGARHYWIITAALVRAQRHIDEFAVGGNYVCPEVFKRNDPMRPNALGLDIAAFSGLKRLHLRLASCEEGSAPEYCDNIEGLPKLLGSMHLLQRLHLDLSYAFGGYPSMYMYGQVFPQMMTWNHLEKLDLGNFASSATNLLRLLLIQMPKIKYIGLGVTQLLEGCWESAIECLKQFKQFTTFEIVSDSELYHHGVEVLDCDNEKINKYVTHGGRHPCLSEDQPASASEAYMLEIDASLRDRLLEVKSARTRVTI